MENLNSFTFYRDYFNLIDTLPIKDKKDLAVAILDYVFKDTEPKLTGHNQAIFNTLCHQLNVSKNKSKSAKKNISNENQLEIKLKSNENQMKIKKDNKTSILYLYISNFNNINNNIKLKNKIEEWIKYKKENNFTYKETGLKVLLKQIDTICEEYGADNVIRLINESITNGYKGIIFDKLKKSKKVPNWYEKEIETNEISEQEQQQMDKLLEAFK